MVAIYQPGETIHIGRPRSGVRLSGGASFAGAYDAIPNIAAAYGMHRLRSAYAGNLLRLRRSSDNAESNFGYVANGDLDAAAIAAFVGGGSGYVTTWYDQSGNGYNAVQTTAANQPLYVASNINSLPALRFDGTDYLAESTFVMDLRARTFFVVARQTVDDAYAGILSILPAAGNDNDRADALILQVNLSTSDRPRLSGSTSSDYVLTGPTVTGVMPLAIYCERKAPGGTGRLYKDGGVETGTDATYTEFASASGGGLLVGGRYLSGAIDASYRLQGDIAEIVIVQGELSVADSNLIGNDLERFGTTWGDIS